MYVCVCACVCVRVCVWYAIIALQNHKEKNIFMQGNIKSKQVKNCGKLCTRCLEKFVSV